MLREQSKKDELDMVATAPAQENKEYQGIIYGKPETVSVEEFIDEFYPCPESLYIRGRDEITEGRINELKEELLITKEPTPLYQVLESIKYIILTQETIDRWKCGDDVKAGVPYILNGNSRLATLETLYKENIEGVRFADVPLQEVTVNSEADDSIIYNLQIKYNDSTVSHTTVAKVRSIANLLKRKVASGMTLSEARKQCARISGISPGYVSNAEKFIDYPDMGEELLEERRKLFEKLNSNMLSFDSVVTIMQIGEKFKKKYSTILDELKNEFGVVIKPGQNIFSKNQIIAYRRKLEKDLADKQAAELRRSQGETDDDSDDTEEKTITEEEISKARENIKIVLQSLPTTDESGIKPEEIATYKENAQKLASIAKRLIKRVEDPNEYQRLYTHMSSIVIELLTNEEVYGKLDSKDLVTVGTGLKAIFDNFTKPPKEAKAAKGKKDDDSTAVTGEQTELQLENSEAAEAIEASDEMPPKEELGF